MVGADCCVEDVRSGAAENDKFHRITINESYAGMESVRHFVKTYVKPWALLGFTYFLSVFYSILVLVNIGYQYYKKRGKSENFWSVKKRPIPPACLNDPIYGTHNYIQLKNVKLHYVEAGSRDKPLMIFIHGYPEFWFSWRHQIKEFSKDYWVIAIDTRGCGDSEKPQGVKYYNLKYLVDDLKNLLDALEQKTCILTGHDFGGVISWLFIMQYPTMVSKYIFLNTPHPKAYRHNVTTSLTQFRMSWYVFFYQMYFLPEISMTLNDMAAFKLMFRNKKEKKCVLNEEELEAYKFIYGKPGVFSFPLSYYRANFSIMSPPKQLANKNEVEQPKGLLIFGEDDFYLDAHNLVEKTKEFVPGLETEFIPGACHFVHQDQPEKVNQLMRAFLEKK